MMFNDFKKNVYSQNGEDGILEEILKKLDLRKNGWCCEFGAWDGKRGSNTFNLVKNYSSIYTIFLDRGCAFWCTFNKWSVSTSVYRWVVDKEA